MYPTTLTPIAQELEILIIIGIF